MLFCRDTYVHDLFREPLNVPLAYTLNISDNQFERPKVESSNSIKRHIKQDQSPFKERIGSVRYGLLGQFHVKSRSLTSRHSVDLVLDEKVNQRH